MVKLWTLLHSFLGLALKRSAEKKVIKKLLFYFTLFLLFSVLLLGFKKGVVQACKLVLTTLRNNLEMYL